jgi:predicted Zn-dependent peptidase
MPAANLNGHYQKSTLANGLRVITVPMSHVRSATVAVFVRTGSRYETKEEAGISHFIEHMHFKGTKNRPVPQQISEAVEKVGGYLNAGTDREMTSYWAKVPKPAFEMTVELLSDMLLNSLLRAKDIEGERKVILEEINSINDSPQQRADMLIDELLWPNQPLGRDAGGTKEAVSKLTRRQMLSYKGRQYAPNNAVVAVSGAFGHEEVVLTMERAFGEWQRTKPRTWFPAVNGKKTPRVGVRDQKTEQAHLCISYHGLSATDPDRYALDLLNNILGDGMSSRLFIDLRENRSLCYEVFSYVSHFMDDGAVTIYAGVDAKSIDEAVTGILKQVDGVMAGVTKDEMQKAKEMTKGRLLLQTEDTRSMAAWFGAQEALRGEIKTMDDIVEAIDKVRAEDVQRVADKLLKRERALLGVVGPYKSEARFRRLLEA